MTEYYFAEKSCSRGVQKRVLLSVEDNSVGILKGGFSVHDEFEVGSDGKPFCPAEDSGIGYLVYLVNQENLSNVMNKYEFGDFTRESRSSSKLPFRL